MYITLKMTITFANVEMMPWLLPIGRNVKEEVKEVKSKGEKPPKKPRIQSIKHPLFAECAKMTGDEYWQYIFNQASYNKFPENFSICGRYLMHRHKGKYRRLELPSDPHDAFVKCKSFFRLTACMTSSLDLKIESKESLELSSKTNSIPTNWREIKKKSRKNIMIQEYINYVTKQLNLSPNEKKQLQTVINCGVQMSLFTYEHIKLYGEKGEETEAPSNLSPCSISSIKGLLYDQDNRHFTIDVDNLMSCKKIKSLVFLEDEVYLNDHIKLTDRFNKPINFDKLWIYWLEHFNPSKPKTQYHTSTTDAPSDSDKTNQTSVNSST